MSAWTAEDRGGRMPGDWLLSPWVLGAVALLALNDHVLKRSYGNWWTGKLSDAAGMVFFPWFLVCLWELLRWAMRRPWHASPSVVHASVAITLLGFSLVNLSHATADLFVSTVQAVWDLLAALGAGALCPGPVRHTVDPSDLLATPLLLVPWRLGLRRLGHPPSSSSRRCPAASPAHSPRS